MADIRIAAAEIELGLGPRTDDDPYAGIPESDRPDADLRSAHSPEALADDVGLPVSFVRRRVRELSDAVGGQVPSLADSPALGVLDAVALKEHAARIASRAQRLAATVAR